MNNDTKMTDLTIQTSDLGKWPKIALIGAVVGLIVTAIGFFMQSGHPDLFYRSYLIGIMFWFNMAAGCLFWLMVQHLSGGAWGMVTRRIWEAATRTLPLLVVMFIPIAINLETLPGFVSWRLIGVLPLMVGLWSISALAGPVHSYAPAPSGTTRPTPWRTGHVP